MKYADLITRANNFSDKVAQKWDGFTDNLLQARDAVSDAFSRRSGTTYTPAATLGYKDSMDAKTSTIPVTGTPDPSASSLRMQSGAPSADQAGGGEVLSARQEGSAYADPEKENELADALLLLPKTVGYLGMRALGGVIGAGDDIWDFAVGGVNKLLGREDKAKEAFGDSFADKYRKKIDDEFDGPLYQDDGLIKKTGDFVETLGTAVPGAAAATIGGILGGGAPFALSALVAGLKTAGRSTRRAYEATGELEGKEFGYGALAGATEAAANLATGYLLRNKLASKTVPSDGDNSIQLGKAMDLSGAGLAGKLIGRAASVPKSIPENPLRMVTNFGLELLMPSVINTVSEVLEGGLAAWIDPYLKRLTYDKNAENASAPDIAKAALIEGGSAALLGWLGLSTSDISFWNNDADAHRAQQRLDAADGAEADTKGKTQDILTEAEKMTQMPGDYPITRAIREGHQKLSASLAKTGNKVETEEQKQILGELRRNMAARQIVPLVENSALSILAYPEAVAEKYKYLGLTDGKGSPIEITADDLTEGIDFDGTEEEFFASVQKALTKNRTLAMLSTADMADKAVRPDTDRLSWMQYGGVASEAQRAEMSSLLGVDIGDYAAAKKGAKQYASTPEGQERIKIAGAIEQKAKSVPPNDKPTPTVIGTGMPDGIYRFGGEDGIAIIKENGMHRVYDYARGLISKPLTAMQVNAALARGRNQKE